MNKQLFPVEPIRRLQPLQISNYLPPLMRDALVNAGGRRDHALIDKLTDELAETWPELVIPRRTNRPQFRSRREDEVV